MNVLATLEARTADRAIACLRKAIEELWTGWHAEKALAEAWRKFDE
jgi:hypothetical protein